MKKHKSQALNPKSRWQSGQIPMTKIQNSKLKFSFEIFKIVILNLFVIWSLVLGASLAYASETNGTIVSGGNNGYAWSNQVGWVNFGCSGCGISITDAGVTGYAWNNNHGWINMSPTNGGVTIATNGALSGYAWGSDLGWINFSGVSINSSGKFIGQASGANVGTLTLDCANCSVVTDFRAQNFRTVVPAPTTVISGGGGGGGGGGGILYVFGPGGQPVHAHISAFNAPIKLYPAQSGILTQGLTNQKSVVLNVPTNVFSDEIIFVVEEETVSIAPTAEIQVIGNALFNVSAVDKNGNRVRTFEKPIKITFIVPDSLLGRSDLAVYFFDETARAWIKISDAVFVDDSVSFFVDHLTLFAIFAGPELPQVVAPTFPLPILFEFEIPIPEVGVTDTGEIQIETEEVSEENSPLFDIEVSPGPAEDQGPGTLFFVVIAIIILAVIVIMSFVIRRIKKHQ